MCQLKSQPCSRDDLRHLAMQIRKLYGLENTLFLPVVPLLEVLHKYFTKFYYQIVEDWELPKDIHAQTDVAKQVIMIKESVYDGACKGNGRDRMTIAHEIGHYFLICVFGLSLKRDFSKKPIRTCEDPEWQAKCFAGELLMAKHLVKGMGENEIARKCGVSIEAARTQLRAMRGRR